MKAHDLEPGDLIATVFDDGPFRGTILEIREGLAINTIVASDGDRVVEFRLPLWAAVLDDDG